MTECRMQPTFLSDEDVIWMHAAQLEAFGGTPGIGDFKLLDSALAQPKATYGGNYLHDGLFRMAAAYLFHLTQNHPFIDGNKRVGLNAAIVFLSLNGIELVTGTDELTELTLAVARGEKTKDEIASVLREVAEAQVDMSTSEAPMTGE